MDKLHINNVNNYYVTSARSYVTSDIMSMFIMVARGEQEGGITF